MLARWDKNVSPNVCSNIFLYNLFYFSIGLAYYIAKVQIVTKPMIPSDQKRNENKQHLI